MADIKQKQQGRKMKKQYFGLISGPILYFSLHFYGNFEGLSQEGHDILAAALWMAVWWIFEAVPIAVTALLPLVLFPLSGALDIKKTAALYAHPIIFLFVGGFMIATAIERWNLHKRVALGIIGKIGNHPESIILGFMVATGFLSMWISNTATTIMMLPIGLAIIQQLKESESNSKKTNNFARALLLGIAYSASIGGISTLIGTPTNVIFSGLVEDKYGVEISFATWMLFATPVAVFLLFVCWYYLVKVIFKISNNDSGDTGMHKIRDLQTALGPVSYEEKVIMLVFGGVSFCWITRSFLLNPFLPGLTDTIIAICGAILLFIIPAKNKSANQKHQDIGMDETDDSPQTILNWESAVQIPWGVILLFGGGLSLANAFDKTGLADWLGTQISLFGALPLFVLLLLLIASVNFLTEITSNVATVSMILPVLAALSVAIGVHPFLLMVGATCAASCAFMLPVATAPNAIVFGSEYIRIGDMIKAGIGLNLLSILLFSIYVYFLMPYIFGIEINGILPLIE